MNTPTIHWGRRPLQNLEKDTQKNRIMAWKTSVENAGREYAAGKKKRVFHAGKTEAKGKQPLIYLTTLSPPFALPPSPSAHSVHLHLHYSQPELIWWGVIDGWVLMPFIEMGSGGWVVSAFCKVASAVFFNIVWLLAATQLAESVESLFTGWERSMCVSRLP